jgi:PhoH-like ATPase
LSAIYTHFKDYLEPTIPPAIANQKTLQSIFSFFHGGFPMPKGRPKFFVLDTNVLLHNPKAIFLFEDNQIILPIIVIEEIDRFKKELSEIGRNARAVSRILDDLRQSGKLNKGVDLPGGGSLRIVLDWEDSGTLGGILFNNNNDNRILGVALRIQKENPGARTILVTKDTNLRIKADALDMEAEDFENAKVDIEELYSGASEFEVPGELIDELYAEGTVEIESSEETLYPNQFLTLIDEGNPNHTALCRLKNGESVQVVKKLKGSVFSLKPRNREQRFALDILLDDDLKLVTLVGKAGTGKTLLALAAALEKVVKEEVYQRILISRPIVPMGRDVGFLPGSIDEKLRPWMQPIYDNLEFLLSNPNDKAAQYTRLTDLENKEVIQMEALTFIRGRSIPNQFLIIDEAQNLTPHEVKTVITRTGEGTKVVLTGDPYQIDNPYLDSSSNGLSYVVEKLKGQEISGHVSLYKGERSGLAELAANLL